MNARYDPANLAQMLGSVPYIRSLQQMDLQAIVTSGQVRHYAEGKPLFHERAPCARLFVLVKGRVQLYKLGPDGREHIMSVHEPVIMFNAGSAGDRWTRHR